MHFNNQLTMENNDWITYPRAEEILNIMSDLMNFKKNNRMPNILIYGDTNNGKTEILKKFCSDNPPQLNPLVDNVRLPVLYTECCVSPDEKRIYNFILEALNVPSKPYANLDYKKNQALNALKSMGCKLLIIDEIHHILTSSALKQRISMTTIKHISNVLNISIVLAGTKDALRIVHTDDQLENRFPAYELPRWSPNKEYVSMLKSLSNKFSQCDPPYAINKEFAKEVYSRSSGVLGMTSKIIKKCIEKNPKELSPKLISDEIFYKP